MALARAKARSRSGFLDAAAALVLATALCGAARLGAQVDASPQMQALLRRAAANEAGYVRARGEYTYRQQFQFFAFDQHHNFGGAYQVTAIITFTPDGKRFEKDVRGPTNTLRIISLTSQDFTDLRNVIPFLLTPEVLPRYTIRDAGSETVALVDARGRAAGKIATEAFFVSPRQIFPGQRYFHGKVWIDPATGGVVRISGRPEPQIRRWVRGSEEENLFGQFTTQFARVDGRFWFPVLTRGDDWLDFSQGPVEIRESVRFSDYHHFGASATIHVVGPER